MDLPRTLEPEWMDSPSDADEYDAMDHREVNDRFVADLTSLLGPTFSGVTLDLGTGTALIPILLCQQLAQVHVVALDAAESMLMLARRHVAAAGLSERIELERADAKSLPYRAGSFAATISNSIVHHIPDPRPVLAEIVRVTHPGGVIFVRDLARPASEAEVVRLVATYAAGANDHQRQLFADSLRAALRLDEIRQLVKDLGFSPSDVTLSSDRHWTWSTRLTGQ